MKTIADVTLAYPRASAFGRDPYEVLVSDESRRLYPDLIKRDKRLDESIRVQSSPHDVDGVTCDVVP